MFQDSQDRRLCAYDEVEFPHQEQFQFIETEQVLVNGDYRRAHPWAKAGRYVLLSVRDTGVGMHPDVAERVFEPFFTTKPPGEGTGLGLSICHNIVVEGNGGSLTFETQEGEFTEFIVTLPKHLSGPEPGAA